MIPPRTARWELIQARLHPSHPAHTWKYIRTRLFLMRWWRHGRRIFPLLRPMAQLETKRRSTRFPPSGLRQRKLNIYDTVRGRLALIPFKAYVRLDGLFFNEFLKHVPIIHPILGRRQITEDDQLAAIACALGSLAADDVPPGYICAIWMQTYKRVSAKVVRPLDVMPLTFAETFTEGRGCRLHARFSLGILFP